MLLLDFIFFVNFKYFRLILYGFDAQGGIENTGEAMQKDKLEARVEDSALMEKIKL